MENILGTEIIQKVKRTPATQYKEEDRPYFITLSQKFLPYCHWYSECFILPWSILSNHRDIERTVFHLRECQGGKYTADCFPNQKEKDMFLISESTYKTYFTDDLIFGRYAFFFWLTMLVHMRCNDVNNTKRYHNMMCQKKKA